MRKISCVSIAVRIVFTALCILLTGFIFYNSIQTAENSSQASEKVVVVVQGVASAVAPNSAIATATGADYDALHAFVRKLGHFSEFAMLGCFLVWCVCTYTEKKSRLWIPLACVATIAVADECLQIFISGRGAEIVDVLTDVLGGICGGGIAFFAFWLGSVWISKLLTQKKRG